MSATIDLEDRGFVLVLAPAAPAVVDAGTTDVRRDASAAADCCDRAAFCLEEASRRSGGRVLIGRGGVTAAAWPATAAQSGMPTGAAAALQTLREVALELAGTVSTPARMRAAIGSGPYLVVSLGDGTIGRIPAVLGSAVHEAALALRRSPHALVAASPTAGGGLVLFDGAGGVEPAAGRAGSGDPSRNRWGELVQRATLALVRLDLRMDRAADSLESLDRTVALVQRECARSGGSLISLLPFGSSPSLLCVFGVDRGATDRHSASAVEAALRIRRNAPREGVGLRVAITCGAVSWQRAVGRYSGGTVLGDPLLRAYALLEADAGAIVCDAATHEENRGQFESAEAIPGLFVISGTPGAVASGARRGVHTLVGREDELLVVREHLQPATEAGRLVWITGEAGVGKSAFLEEVVDWAGEDGRHVYRGAGDPVAPDTPFSAWRALARSELEPLLSANPDSTLALSEAVIALGHEAEFAPLLAAVADVAMPETGRSASLGQSARGVAIEQIIVSLVRRIARRGRPLLVIDDAHWVDDSSLYVVLRLLDARVGVDVVVLGRPSTRAGAWAMLQSAATATMVLGELDETSRTALVTRLCGADSVAPSAVEWLGSIAGGNPLFVGELVRSALERGRLRVVSGALEAMPVAGLDEPVGTLEAVIERRIAMLPDDDRTVLCCASVAGARFDRQALDHLLPESLRGEALGVALERLSRQGLLESSDCMYRFRHELVRVGAYGMLPDLLRRSLHGTMAELTGSRTDELPIRREMLLGHHWEGAGRADMAARHYAAAAYRAVCDGGAAEGVALYGYALRADDAAGSGRVTALDRARWESHLAGAHWAIGDMARAESLARRSLERAGDPFPAHSAAYTRRMVRDALRIVRWWSGKHREPSAEDRERLLVCMDAARRLADSQYFVGDSSALLCACLAATTQALRCKDLAPAARAAGLVAYTAGLIGLRSFSDRLFARSLAAAEAAGDLGGIAGTIGAETMLRVGQADWKRAVPLAERAIELCRRGLDSHDVGAALTLAGLANYFRGRFAPAAAAFLELREMAVANRRDQHRAWAGFALAQTMLPRGEAAAALPALAEASELLIGLADTVSLTICRCVEAAAYVRLGQLDRAAEATLEAARLARSTPPRNFGSLEGYAGSVEASLALARAGGADSAERRRWLNEAGLSMPALAAYARLFPVGRPRLRLAAGWIHWLSGRPRRAERCWRAALREARVRGAAYDELRIARSLEETGFAASTGLLLSSDEVARLRPHPLVI